MEHGVPMVVTNDVYYMKPEDAEAHEVLLCLQSGKNFLDDENRMRFPSQEFYFKSPEQMTEMFADCPKAIENTEEIANKCHVEIDFESRHLPKFDIPEGRKPIMSILLNYVIPKWLKNIRMPVLRLKNDSILS